MTARSQHEEATIRAFVLKNKQERFLSFISKPKSREKFTRELSHFRWLDQRFITPIKWSPDPTLKLHERHRDGIEKIAHLLRSKGAGKTCWVISEFSELDQREMDLLEVLSEVTGSQMGTILSCVPGKLAYFEGEDESLLLLR